ncbi:hypothetical protein FEZ42_15200 [Lactiplantibacillus plantarum]|uniref:hypothetical protein n=1 Tax=Lactiplantibacillus plantarum TaxID=1590 RepID=UPI0009776BEE|nr:hypothetical protein [Lactiplantibacillus plantarum]TLQ21323.1 hypothetical protein FEZ42_15200 [Lactiplantibacillus plantarum]
MFLKMKNSRYFEATLTLIIISLLALISTYPAFSGYFFELSNDGGVHLARLESLYQAFNAGRAPSLINFIGFNNQGVAMNAMYPWITLLIYIIPRLIIDNPMLALAIGFWLMNFFTILNSYWLAKSLTRNRLIILLSVSIYQFSAYHLQLMYTRVALGEALGYTFLPLIMLGLFQIWNRKKQGTIVLAIGMGLVANSHILSLVLFTVLISFLEIIRLLCRNLSWHELLQLLIGAFISIIMSSYSLYNIVDWLLHNKMVAPARLLISLDPLTSLNRMLTNNIGELARGAHLGIIVTFIFLYLISQLISNQTGSWRYWIIGAASIWVLSQNWIDGDFLANTPVSLFQFTMRFLTIVVLLLTIGSILFLVQINWHSYSTTLFISFALITVGMSGVISAHNQTKQNYFWALKQSKSNSLAQQRRNQYLTNANYQKRLVDTQVPDYHIKKAESVQSLKKVSAALNFATASRATKKTVQFDADNSQKFKNTFANDQLVTFKYHQKNMKSVKLPVIGYKNVNYSVKVNGKKKNFKYSEGQLKTALPAGDSYIDVSIARQSKHIGLLLLTGITFIGSLVYLATNCFKPKYN